MKFDIWASGLELELAVAVPSPVTPHRNPEIEFPPLELPLSTFVYTVT